MSARKGRQGIRMSFYSAMLVISSERHERYASETCNDKRRH